MVDHSRMKLGKLPARKDPRTLQLSKYLLPGALPAVPMACDWMKAAGTDYGMMGNDTVGDCTCAAAGHAIQLWTANATKEITITTAQVLAAYAAITGYSPNDPNSDQGANPLDVLKYWRKKGIGGHKTAAFVQVDQTNLEHLRAACWLFGGMYGGLALPRSAQKQDVWDVPKGGARGKGAPGSWGGHMVEIGAYIQTAMDCVTWGARKTMTMRFVLTYSDECYAVLSQDWIEKSLKAPCGFDTAALLADLKRL